MRILHVGSGFSPFRRGGAVGYLQDLIFEQARRGHEVAYFLSGRQYPFPGGPRLKRWSHDGVPIYEVVNSPLFDHGRQPQLELGEPRIERIFERVLTARRPDVVHVHELAGLPTSLLDLARPSAPVVMTLHDYFPLCSTFRLLDSEQQVCLRREIGADCMATIAADPRRPGMMFESTIGHDLMRRSLMQRVDSPPVASAVKRLAVTAGRLGARARAGGDEPAPTPEAFQRRRDVNVDRLNRVDRLVAVSHRVGEIYALLGVDPNRIVTTQLTLAHIERLRPRFPSGRTPVTFATLGGGETAAKGSRLLAAALRALAQQVDPGLFRVLVFSQADPAVKDALAATPSVELCGTYGSHELDARLEDVDVGLIPSIWEEAYGLAGIEFLAKGIPVIANAIGGIVEYARDGETGWLNHSRSVDELASLMRKVIERPRAVCELSEKVRAARDSIVIPLSRHADEMDDLYRELSAA